MHKSIHNLNQIQKLLKEKTDKKNIPKIVAVSKTFPISDIQPLLEYGHIDYGENKIQEALDKWSLIKEKFQNIKLHMVGKIQTNKVKFLLPLFDYLHSLDNLKLARKISIEQEKKKKKLKIFIQVNIGNEIQKSGVHIEYLEEFYSVCTKELNLDIIGLMCLPPNDDKTKSYFAEMQKLNIKFKLNELSMGMSNDYLTAVDYNSTFVRIGSKIFGNRN
tara:strand:+ start:414 stop:1067 length:654 start_codon:yes stop_codon:yes gene_type:complete